LSTAPREGPTITTSRAPACSEMKSTARRTSSALLGTISRKSNLIEDLLEVRRSRPRICITTTSWAEVPDVRLADEMAGSGAVALLDMRSGVPGPLIGRGDPVRPIHDQHFDRHIFNLLQFETELPLQCDEEIWRATTRIGRGIG
jgi:hypothetical protein